VLIVACGVGLGGSAAFAKRVRSTPRALSGSEFQGGDGDQLDSNGPGIDWQGLKALGRVNYKADCPPGVMSPCPTASDDIFGGGSKELSPGDWSLDVQNGGGANPAKGNILDSYWSFEHGTGDAFLYVGFTRQESAENGNSTVFITFELNQVAEPWFNGHASIPCRTTGDILVTFQPHGDVLDIFQVQEWHTTGEDSTTHCATEGTLEDLPVVFPPSQGANVEAAFNHSSIENFLPPASVATIGAGEFGEAAINLSSVLAGDQDPCSTFGSIWMHSRASSQSEQAQLKDYLAPTPFSIATCKAAPKLSSTASGTTNPGGHGFRHVRLGARIFDTAHLSDGVNPTGTITFGLFGPNDPTCSGHPIFRSRSTVTANGPYNSRAYTPTAVGVYRWRVRYSGDDNNDPAGPTACGDPNETVRITPAHPKIATVASARTILGNPITDSATLSGGVHPTGKITFRVYGPDNDACAGKPADRSSATVSGNDTYESRPFTPTQAGTYRWVAKYSGDENNRAAATHCGDPGESVVVVARPTPPPAMPELTSTASTGGPVGSPIHDTAHLSGGSNPTGSITFYIYGPDSADCDTPAAPPSSVSVSGAGDYKSAPFTPTVPGTYRWVAAYSGDANNAATATGCNEETVVVTGAPPEPSKAQPSISTQAAPVSVRSGAAVGDTALLAGGSNPQGTITFRLYGPDDSACSAPPVFVAEQNVIGNGHYPSPLPTPPIPGTYRWVATYSGDANNASAASRCGDPGETVVVEPAPVHQQPEKPTPKPKPPTPPRPPAPPNPSPPPVTG
jgi:hypothetical protein